MYAFSYKTRSVTASQQPEKTPAKANRYTVQAKRTWLSILKKSGLSPEDFAKSKIERGRCPPSAPQLRRWRKRVDAGETLSPPVGRKRHIDSIGIQNVKDKVEKYITMDEAR
jgi:hypothetical protein